MIIPAIGNLAGGLTSGLASGPTAAAQPTAGVQGAGLEGPALEGTAGTGAEGGESFGNELSEAISSLEKTQENAGSAAQALATGTAKNPESAVTTVEDAQLAMQFAAQLRSKATETVQSVFQTQV